MLDLSSKGPCVAGHRKLPVEGAYYSLNIQNLGSSSSTVLVEIDFLFICSKVTTLNWKEQVSSRACSEEGHASYTLSKKSTLLY